MKSTYFLLLASSAAAFDYIFSDSEHGIFTTVEGPTTFTSAVNGTSYTIQVLTPKVETVTYYNALSTGFSNTSTITSQTTTHNSSGFSSGSGTSSGSGSGSGSSSGSKTSGKETSSSKADAQKVGAAAVGGLISLLMLL